MDLHQGCCLCPQLSSNCRSGFSAQGAAETHTLCKQAGQEAQSLDETARPFTGQGCPRSCASSPRAAEARLLLRGLRRVWEDGRCGREPCGLDSPKQATWL